MSGGVRGRKFLNQRNFLLLDLENVLQVSVLFQGVQDIAAFVSTFNDPSGADAVAYINDLYLIIILECLFKISQHRGVGFHA